MVSAAGTAVSAASGGRDKPSLLADALEAILGAVYLDGGLDAAARLAEELLEHSSMQSPKAAVRDPKTALQEAVQALGWSLPEYRIASEEGPDHRKLFAVECWLEGGLRGIGEGPSKKSAQQRAAAAALRSLPEAE